MWIPKKQRLPRPPRLTPQELLDQTKIANAREQCRSLALLVASLEVECKQLNDEVHDMLHGWAMEKMKRLETMETLRRQQIQRSEILLRHSATTQVYQKRIKQLIDDHKAELFEAENRGRDAVSSKRQEHALIESKLQLEIDELKDWMIECERIHAQRLREEQLHFTCAERDLCSEFDNFIVAIQAKYDKRTRSVSEQVSAKRADEKRRVEERRDLQFATLTNTHAKSYADIKAYYSDLTSTNLDLIESLRADLATRHESAKETMSLMDLLLKQNTNMTQQLAAGLAQLDRLRAEFLHREQDLETLKTTQANTLVIENQLERLVWKQGVLYKRFKQASRQRDELYAMFLETGQELQERTRRAESMLERQVELIAADLDESERPSAIAAEQLAKETSGAEEVAGKIEELLESKDKAIRLLQEELQRVVAGYEEMLTMQESRVNALEVKASMM